jgi:hypothetical protein
MPGKSLNVASGVSCVLMSSVPWVVGTVAAHRWLAWRARKPLDTTRM